MTQVIKNELLDTNLTKQDFYYDLPEELIAQHPTEKRDEARLMVIHRDNGVIEHKKFYDVIDYLEAGDVLVINDSKVIPARIYGHVLGDQEKVIELLLLRQRENDVWEVLVKPGKRARLGNRLVFGDGILDGEIIDIVEEGNRLIRFSYDNTKYQNIYVILNEIGIMPLPPYITEKLKNNDDYQTVYANKEGSAAAPTAGLHFTTELLEKIKNKGITVVPVMLHVGLGTFRPVKEDKITDHIMHTEYISVSQEAADVINQAKSNGRRVVCVGTTSCRTLESVTDEEGIVHAYNGETGIFIYPGYRFKIVDALITNFHLPESTLLMLVSAFYNREKMLDAYHLAVREKYRFFSFGDGMIIL